MAAAAAAAAATSSLGIMVVSSFYVRSCLKTAANERLSEH